jgi:hypothetical protein
LFPLCHFSSHVNTFLFLHQLKVTPGQTLESTLSGAVQLYLENQPKATVNTQSDPLISLFKGSPNLATESEEILEKEMGIYEQKIGNS